MERNYRTSIRNILNTTTTGTASSSKSSNSPRVYPGIFHPLSDDYPKTSQNSLQSIPRTNHASVGLPHKIATQGSLWTSGAMLIGIGIQPGNSKYWLIGYLWVWVCVGDNVIESGDLEEISMIRAGINLHFYFWENMMEIWMNMQTVAEGLDMTKKGLSNWIVDDIYGLKTLGFKCNGNWRWTEEAVKELQENIRCGRKVVVVEDN